MFPCECKTFHFNNCHVDGVLVIKAPLINEATETLKYDTIKLVVTVTSRSKNPNHFVTVVFHPLARMEADRLSLLKHTITKQITQDCCGFLPKVCSTSGLLKNKAYETKLAWRVSKTLVLW